MDISTLNSSIPVDVVPERNECGDSSGSISTESQATPLDEQTLPQASSTQNNPSQNLEQQHQNLEGYPEQQRLLVGNIGNRAMEQATTDLPGTSISAQSQEERNESQDQEEAKNKTGMDDLDDDTLMLIFAKLHALDRTRSERVSKRWNQLIARVWLSETRLNLSTAFSSLRRSLTMSILRQLLNKCPNLRKLSVEGVTRYLDMWTTTELMVEACPLLELVNLRGFIELMDRDLLILGEQLPHLSVIRLGTSCMFTDHGIRAFLEANSAASALTTDGLETLDLVNCSQLTGHNMFPKALSKSPRRLKRLIVYGALNNVKSSILIRDLIRLREHEENKPAGTVAFPLTHLNLAADKSDMLALIADNFADTLISLYLRKHSCVDMEGPMRGIETVHRLRSLESLWLTCPPFVGLTNTALKQILLELLSLRELVIDCTLPPAPPASDPVPQGLGEGEVQEQDQLPAGDAAPAGPEVIGDEGVAPIRLARCSPTLEVIALPNSQVSGAALRQFTWLEHLRELSLERSLALDDDSLIAFFNETSSIGSLKGFNLNKCSSLTANGVWGALEAFRARAPPESKDLLVLWYNGRLISDPNTTYDYVSRALTSQCYTDMDYSIEYHMWLADLEVDSAVDDWD